MHLSNPHDLATGKWHSILSSLGIDSAYLKRRHGPCPMCQGRDRFRFDDKNGRGTFICNQCGAGDGFRLLELFHGWSFKEALEQVTKIAGVFVPQQQQAQADDRQKIAMVRQIWDEALPLEAGDPAETYLKARTGLSALPKTLRYHPALTYVDDAGEIDYHPALVAVVQDANGQGAGIHRIYLDSEGNKAKVEKQKKLLAGKALNGGAIRLFPAGECLGIAEGIETAMAASRIFEVPVWAAISAGLMEQWNPPESVGRVMIFGDNDASFTGQASAFVLAKRLRAKGLEVEVHIPQFAGKDWADE